MNAFTLTSEFEGATGLKRSLGLRRDIALLLAFLTCLASQVTGQTLADAGHKKVLALSVVRKELPGFLGVDEALQEELERALDGRLDYYARYVDLVRFANATFQASFRPCLGTRSDESRLDLIVASTPEVLAFLKDNPSLFPGVPIVFSTTRRATAGPHSTGIVSDIDFGGTLLAALDLQPRTKRVFAVSGNAPYDRSVLDLFKSHVNLFAGRVTFTELTGLSLADLKQRLGRLPSDSIVFYLSVSEDAIGRRFEPFQVLEEVAAASSAPVYSWHESAIGRGVVGGRLHSFANTGREAARVALRILRGEPAESIPVADVDSHSYEFDWRELHRWGLDETHLPPRSVVHFRPPPFVERYRSYAPGGVMIVVAQSLLICGLLVQWAKHRHALQLNRTLANRLITSQEEERRRIARELHDDLGQRIALLNMEVDHIIKEVWALPQRAGLQNVSVQAGDIARSLRALSHKLHPTLLETLGLIGSIRVLCDEISQQGHVKVTFTHADVPRGVDPSLSLCLYRVTQEALHNIAKHSRAHEASVKLIHEGNELNLQILDSGVGFDQAAVAHAGLGLASMRERVGILRGQFVIQTRSGGGTRINVRLPLSAAGDAAFSETGSA